MSRPKKLLSDQEFEDACNKRNKQALDALVQASPAGPLAFPGWRRWNGAMEQIEAVMTQMETEMEAHYDQRSKRWRKSVPACELILRLGDLQEVRDAVRRWIEWPCDIADYPGSVTLQEWEDRYDQTP
jgi:hypothetical protein